MTAITGDIATEMPSSIGLFAYVATIGFTFMMVGGTAFYLFFNLLDV